jgi:hypothetical protein
LPLRILISWLGLPPDCTGAGLLHTR